jgi:hypothetical protein
MKKKSKKSKVAAKKFGVSHLAKKLGIKAATARIKLRNAKIRKSGKGYGWDTSTELDAVAQKLAA